MTIYEQNGKIWHPIGADAAADTGSIGLPKSDAYANEIRYFADCVKAHKAPDRVRADQLETVIGLLKTLN